MKTKRLNKKPVFIRNGNQISVMPIGFEFKNEITAASFDEMKSKYILNPINTNKNDK